MWDGPLKYCKELIDDFPKIKITLFVTPNWIDLPNQLFIKRQLLKLLGKDYTRTWEGEPFRIDKHPEWCKWLNKQKNFEVCLHGYNHHLNRNPHSAEFSGMVYEEARRRIKLGLALFRKAGLKHVMGFRPPGWGKSPGLMKALAEEHFKFCACDNKGNEPYKLDSLTIIPQNWSIHQPCMIKEGNVLAKCHIQDIYYGEKSGNGLNKINYEHVKELLSREKTRFLSMREMVIK
jgi:peptidoglycan/xylan/chitin deacetylase (PgdA/CDA1 family)